MRCVIDSLECIYSLINISKQRSKFCSWSNGWNKTDSSQKPGWDEKGTLQRHWYPGGTNHSAGEGMSVIVNRTIKAKCSALSQLFKGCLKKNLYILKKQTIAFFLKLRSCQMRACLYMSNLSLIKDKLKQCTKFKQFIQILIPKLPLQNCTFHKSTCREEFSFKTFQQY